MSVPQTVACYILLFFVTAFLGWVMEVGCKLVQYHRFINRGFLLGPYCPIYGFGSVLITLLLTRHADDPLAVFGLAMLLCGTLEYLTSYGMEKLFHARWWDYSGKRFNLNGRVCAGTLIPFGLLGLLLVYVAKPFFFGVFAQLHPRVRDGLCVALCGLLLTDTCVSAGVLGKIRSSAAHVSGDSTEAITQAVRAHLAQEGMLVRRVLRAFPHASLYNARLLARLKAQRAAVRAEVKAARARMEQDVRQREDKLRAEVAELKARKRERKHGASKQAD